MYHALLTNRYLTSRVIPLIAVAAVALCVALVIVVVSVMTGFLDLVKDSGRKLMGDVVVSCPVRGLPYYERLIARIEQLPEAYAATPVADSWGLLKMPYPDGPDKVTETVQIWGIEPVGFGRVTEYENSLHWKELTQDQWDRLFSDVVHLHWKSVRDSLDGNQKTDLMTRTMALVGPRDQPPPDPEKVRQWIPTMTDEQWAEAFDRLSAAPELLKSVLNEDQWQSLLRHDPRLLDRTQILQDGLTLTRNGRPGICLGMHVSQANERQHDGSYAIAREGHWWMPAYNGTLTTLPIEAGSLGDQPESRILPIVNEFASGVYMIDNKRVMIPIEVAQQLLHLQQGDIIDENDPTKVLGIDPARATMVLVRAKDGITPEVLREAVVQAYKAFQQDVLKDQTDVFAPSIDLGVYIRTWAQQQAEFIGPVEKERELMRTLFSIVYLVCAALILSIFWAIVYEKTRDIGILRSVGASRGGIVWIFLRYGLIVGIIGAIVGAILAYGVVRNINVIHDALADPPKALAIVVLVLGGISIVLTVALSLRGRLMPLVVGSLASAVLVLLGIGVIVLRERGGVVIWDPAVYYFKDIPNTMDLTTAYTTMIGAVVFSLLGAAVPAAKAADTDPVQALRYE